MLKEKRVSGLCHSVKWHLVESLPGGREEVAEAAEHAREQGGGKEKGEEEERVLGSQTNGFGRFSTFRLFNIETAVK